MKILFATCSDTRFDGRTRELIKVCRRIGETTVICGYSDDDSGSSISVKKRGLRRVYGCAHEAKKKAKEMGSPDVIFVDNRKASMALLRVVTRYPRAIVVQDARELILIDEARTLSAKTGCYFEQKMFQRADIIICANQERSVIMHDKLNLSPAPLVFENLRVLSFDVKTDDTKFDSKYPYLLSKKTAKVIATSGCEVRRMTDVLLQSLSRLSSDVELLLVGVVDGKDRFIIEEIIKNNNLRNVHLIGRVEESELKYLISHSDIGIVNYGQYDTNNKYCASGKLFEFLYEGLPIVTTSNPSLVSFCENYKVGVVDDNFASGIEELIHNYSFYHENVARYCQENDLEKNVIEFSELLHSKINGLIPRD